jgi:MOSC domain-containing protein YiiM
VQTGKVIAVALSTRHRFSKSVELGIELQAGLGARGDCHAGETVKHRSRVAKDPAQPNMRQVHLIHSELHDMLRSKGFTVHPGDMGENITTYDVDLLSLPTGTQLHIGDSAVVEITGLRNPCSQIDKFQSGLMHAVLDRDAAGNLIRLSGVMAIVLASGFVQAGDIIQTVLPAPPYRKLLPV